MRIAQVSPLFESVPPQLYGGTERVVAHLTDELVAQGHSVTLFASGDSQTSAKLAPICPQALRLHPKSSDEIAWHLIMLEQVRRRAREFDLIHFHLSNLHYPQTHCLDVPHVTTQHGRLDMGELDCLHRWYQHVPLISISDAQRHPLPHARWIATIPHGLPADLYSATLEPNGYFAFLGRISPEKRVDRAIEIATALNRPLKIAAKIDRADRQYFAEVVRPLLDNPLVDFIGEIGESDKGAFLGQAAALLFPIDWPEPFGLVMIESLACGTPVVAFRGGSVDEVIDDGLSGFVVDSMDEAIAAAARVEELSRRACRDAFDRRFTTVRMAGRYVETYEALTDVHAPAGS